MFYVLNLFMSEYGLFIIEIFLIVVKYFFEFFVIILCGWFKVILLVECYINWWFVVSIL